MQLLYLSVLALLSAAVSAADPPTEAHVKAAYVLNFTKFTDWPQQAFSDAQAPLIICVTADATTVSAFADIQGKLVQGRTTEVRANSRGAELKTCHALYLSRTEAAQIPAAIKAVAGRPILTVSDAEAFAETVGMLGLVQLDGRIRFEANVQTARAAGLRFGSQLLKLARIVK